MVSEWQSKEFVDLVKSIGDAQSKAEEERIVIAEVETPKHRMANSEKAPNRNKMKEYIIRLLYVEMLGHDSSFGYIHAVNVENGNL